MAFYERASAPAGPHEAADRHRSRSATYPAARAMVATDQPQCPARALRPHRAAVPAVTRRPSRHAQIFGRPTNCATDWPGSAAGGAITLAARPSILTHGCRNRRQGSFAVLVHFRPLIILLRFTVTALHRGVTPFQRSVPTRFPDWNTFHSSSVSGAPTSGSVARSGSGKEVSQPLVETQQRAPDRPKSRSRSAKCLT